MTNVYRTIVLVFFFVTSQIIFAQTKQEKALEKGKNAIKLEDVGKFKDAVILLEEAQNLDPKNIEYPYELGYNYYAQKDYQKAVKYLEGLLKHPDVYDQVFQLLGNCYDDMGKSDKAFEVYDAGLKKFPNSGKLYLEKGNVYWQKKEFEKALPFYEKGIEVDPKFTSNYYRATIIFCNSTEEVWGMIYGEIFINLERDTKRTAEISKLLYDTYKSQIKILSDTSTSVSFSQNASVNISDKKNGNKIKLPFGTGVYETALMVSLLRANSIDINTLNTIRSNFVDNYFKNGTDIEYPNVLFSFQKKVKDAGFIEAYNYWILMNGDEDGFNKWQAINKEKWNSFAKWYIENGIILDNNNKFFRMQY